MTLLATEPKRMARERRLLEELARAETWFRLGKWAVTESGDLCVLFELTLLSGQFCGVLVYPAQFPDVPAFVRPQAADESWSSHQYLKSGVLCLEHGPDNWHREVTGVDLVRSANLLLWQENLQAVLPRTPNVSSRHFLTKGQEVRLSRWRFVVTPGFLSILDAAEGGKVLPLRARTSVLGQDTCAVPVSLGTSQDAAVKDVPGVSVLGGREHTGWLVPVKSGDLPRNVQDVGELRDAAGSRWPFTDSTSDGQCWLVTYDENRSFRAFVLLGDALSVLQECAVIQSDGGLNSRHPEGCECLPKLTVVVVGLGSLGSKIAVSLARAGVGSFLLLDDDFLTPDNLVRNALDWRSVGFNKVDAVAQAIRLVAPDANVLSLPVGFGTQESASYFASISQVLTNFDLVVDATASPQSFVLQAGLCRRAKVPMVWGELFGGGIGALMARSRPDLDPDALSVRRHIQGVLETYEAAPDNGSQQGARYGLETGGEVLVGSDADVSALAGSMTQFALDTLLAGAESQYPVAAYLLGYKKAWIFKQPFDTLPIDCSSAQRNMSEAEPLTVEEQQSVVELLAVMERGPHAANFSSN